MSATPAAASASAPMPGGRSSMKKFTTIIFDMDGVIVDSEPLHERAFVDIFEEMGYGATHGIDFSQYYGRSDRALWIDFIEKHQPPQTLDFLADWKQRVFLEMLRRDQPIFPELPPLVRRLAANYQLGLASGSFHTVINEVMGMENLREHFPVRVSVQDVPRGKPSPDVFLRAAELLRADPADCCVIEDAAAGVEAARAAGMTAIAITNSLPREKLHRAHRVVSTYREIEDFLLPIKLPSSSVSCFIKQT